MVTHRPADYQPRPWSTDPAIRKEEQRNANRWADEKAQELNQATQLNAQKEIPFVFRIEQAQWNDLLLTDETVKWIRWQWPRVHRQFRDIQFGFDPGSIKIMGQVDYKGIRTVVTILLSLHITDAQRLHISLDSVKAGALPVPEPVIDTQLHRMAETLHSAQHTRAGNESSKRPSEDVKEFMRVLDGWVQDLIQQRTMNVPAEFPVDVDKKARILALEVRKGYIDLTLQPFWAED